MLAKTVVAAFVCARLTCAHMEMSWPYPPRSKYDPRNTWKNIDYSMTSPLYTNGMISTSCAVVNT